MLVPGSVRFKLFLHGPKFKGILATPPKLPPQEQGVNKALLKETWWLMTPYQTLVVGRGSFGGVARIPLRNS